METGNNTTNIQQDFGMHLDDMEFRVVKIMFYVLIFLLSCVGNSLVAFVIVGAKSMRTPPNFLILNLALCDFLTPALSIPFDLALEESKYIWPFGKALCKILWPLETAFSTSSSLTLASISLERHKTLSKPFGRRLTNSHVLIFVLTIHALSISLCIPYFVVLSYNDTESSCDEVWPGVGYRQAYTIVLFLSGYALPLTTMSVAYLLIYRSLRSNVLSLRTVLKKATVLRKRDQGRPRNASKVSESSSVSQDRVENKRKAQNVRLAKMFIIVIVVFAISMYPNQVLWLWADFGNGEENDYFHYISAVCRLCTYANSVLNPFIYALKSKEFRSGFTRIGRVSMQPLRKISSGTRKIARKYSGRSVSEPTAPTRRPAVSAPTQFILSSDSPVQLCSVHTFKEKEKQMQEIGVGERDTISCTSEDKLPVMNNTSFQETLQSSTLHSLIEKLRETDC